jgi:hypothetical protein
MTSPTGNPPPIRTTRVLDPEQIAMQAGRQMPFLRLPVRAAVFSDRQLRLRQLAASHPMREYLIFIADLAQAQHEVLQNYPQVALPESTALEAAAQVLKPPMPAFGWTRDAVWLTQLRRWGFTEGAPDYEGVANQVMRGDIYEEAMKEIGVTGRAAEDGPESLFDGSKFDPKGDLEAYAASFAIKSLKG